MSIISLINKLPIGNPAERGYFLYSKIPPKILKGIEEDNFRKTIQFVYQHSKFYKIKFDERGINPKKVKSPQDLGDFFTTAEDIRSHVEDFVCMTPDTAYETTGTTSKRTKRVYFSRNEVREAGWSGAVGLWALGVRKEDRIVSAFDCSFWVSGPVLQASAGVLGCFHVEAGRMDPDEFYERLKDYGITVIVGDPSWIVRVSEVAQKKGPWPLKLIIAGGENLTEETRHFVEGIWKTDLILSYGQTEAFGAIGIESRDKQGFHLNEFHNYFEIITPPPDFNDPERIGSLNADKSGDGVNLEKDGYGELVYTTLNRRVMPLVRYRSGDITRFITTPSKSDLPGRRIEKLKGRVDEWMATAMGNIAPWMFESLFKGIEGISDDWQIVVEKENNKDLIIFNVESNQGILNETDLKDKVYSKMKKELSESWKFYELGYLKIDLKVHPKGTLRADRKLKRIMDKRKF